MSIFDKDFGFECDNCCSTVGGGIYDFNESLEMRKDQGWINRKFGDEWFSFCCPECLEEFLSKTKIRPVPRKITK